MNTTRGTVRDWYEEEGWGVLDSPDTPGGCFAHYSMLQMDGYRNLVKGQSVEFEWMDYPYGQDGYVFRADNVRLLQ